jgi:hypothetical protein
LIFAVYGTIFACLLAGRFSPVLAGKGKLFRPHLRFETGLRLADEKDQVLL